VWKNAAQCIGHLSKSKTGTLENPHISEAGRRFLAALLVQLTDSQLRDLFEVARVERRDAGAHERPAHAIDGLDQDLQKKSATKSSRIGVAR
jgi:hypothetical protein